VLLNFLLVIQVEITSLATLSSVGGERKDAITTVLAGISRLSNEVMDATDFIPSYDQRAYSQVGIHTAIGNILTYRLHGLGYQSPDGETQ
jgi:hypothetical protein